MPVIPLLHHCKGFLTLSNFSKSLGLQLAKNKNILETLTCTTTMWPPTQTRAHACLHPGHGSGVLQSACTCIESQQQWSRAQALLCFFEAPSCYVHMASTVQGCTSSHVQPFILVLSASLNHWGDSKHRGTSNREKPLKKNIRVLHLLPRRNNIHAQSFGSAVSVPLVEQGGSSKNTVSLWFIANFLFQPTVCVLDPLLVYSISKKNKQLPALDI